MDPNTAATPFDNGGPGWGWASFSLGQVEQVPVYNSINFVLGIEVPANQTTARLTVLGSFLCPSDAWRKDTFTVVDSTTTGTTPGKPICDVASSNYVGSVGTGDASSLYPYIIDDDNTPPGRDNGNGLFFRNHSINIAQITDGTSQTFALGERSQNLSRATWTGAVTNAAVPLVAIHPERASILKAAGRASSRTPEKGTGPDSPRACPWRPVLVACIPVAPISCSPTAASGSSRSRSASSIFQALATRAGGEVLSADQF